MRLDLLMKIANENLFSGQEKSNSPANSGKKVTCKIILYSERRESTMTDLIDYKIYGDDMQIVEIELDPGED